MKKFLTLILFICIYSISVAQQSAKDSVFLKTGNVVVGNIILFAPNDGVKIQLANNQTFYYPMSDILKISKEVIKSSEVENSQVKKLEERIIQLEKKNESNATLRNSYSVPISSYEIFEFGYGHSMGPDELSLLKFNAIKTRKINNNFNFGAGFGLRDYFIDNESVILAPIFFDFRVPIYSNRNCPYLALDAGYTFNLTQTLEPLGFYLSPSVGIGFRLGNESHLSVGIGFEMQNVRSDYGDEGANSLVFNIGLMF